MCSERHVYPWLWLLAPLCGIEPWGTKLHPELFKYIQNLKLHYFLTHQFKRVFWVLCGSTKCSPTQYAPFSSILCTLHTQYATRGAYCVGSVHMLFQWSSEGTQYALLENMSRGMFAFLSNFPLDIHLSILRTLCLEPCPPHNCIIVVFNPHQHLASFSTWNQPLETVVRKNGETPGVKCRNVMNLYESRTPWTFVNAIPVPLEYMIWLPL